MKKKILTVLLISVLLLSSGCATYSNANRTYYQDGTMESESYTDSRSFCSFLNSLFMLPFAILESVTFVGGVYTYYPAPGYISCPPPPSHHHCH